MLARFASIAPRQLDKNKWELSLPALRFLSSLVLHEIKLCLTKLLWLGAFDAAEYFLYRQDAQLINEKVSSRTRFRS